jgi:hypothetical protein
MSLSCMGIEDLAMIQTLDHLLTWQVRHHQKSFMFPSSMQVLLAHTTFITCAVLVASSQSLLHQRLFCQPDLIYMDRAVLVDPLVLRR